MKGFRIISPIGSRLSLSTSAMPSSGRNNNAKASALASVIESSNMQKRHFDLTLNRILAKVPCDGGLADFRRANPKTTRYPELLIPLVDTLKSNPLVDCVWALRACTPEPDNVELQALMAELKPLIRAKLPEEIGRRGWRTQVFEELSVRSLKVVEPRDLWFPPQYPAGKR